MLVIFFSNTKHKLNRDFLTYDKRNRPLFLRKYIFIYNSIYKYIDEFSLEIRKLSLSLLRITIMMYTIK